MRILETALGLALCLCIALAALQLPVASAGAQLSEHTVRLHVLANSDSERDQQLKLAVRDAMLCEMQSLADASSKQEALYILACALPQLQQTAAETLRAAGCPQEVRVHLCEMWFATRHYGEATLPAGRYTALRVELGEAKGQNWWCVLYPALCLPAASEREAQQNAAAAWSEEEQQLVFGEGYELRFWLQEWLQRLAGQHREN